MTNIGGLRRKLYTGVASFAALGVSGLSAVTPPSPTGTPFVSNAVSHNNGTTTHSVALPPVVNQYSTLVLVLFTGTITTPPANFNLVGSDLTGSTKMYVYKKVADGSEAGTLVSYVAASAASVDFAYCVTLQNWQVAAVFNSSSSDPPSSGTLASDQHLYIAASSYRRNDNAAVLTGSALATQGYSNFLYDESSGTNSTSSSSISAAAAHRVVASDTGEDPDTFSWSGNLTVSPQSVTVICTVGDVSGGSAGANTLDFSNAVNSQYLGSVL